MCVTPPPPPPPRKIFLLVGSDVVLLQEVKSRIVQGHNITQEALGSIRRHMARLLTLILTPLTPTMLNPCPFATALRDWTQQFVGDLISTLSAGFNGGVSDASQFIQFFLQTVCLSISIYLY